MYTPTPKVYSVNELNNYVKGLLDNDENLKYIFVSGRYGNRQHSLKSATLIEK